MTVFRVALVAVLALALPTVAQAGTVTKNGATIVYTSAAAGDSIELGTDAGLPYVQSYVQPVGLGGPGDCVNQAVDRVRCNTGSAFQVFLADGVVNDLDASKVTTTQTLSTAGSGTDDRITGTPNADTLGGGGGADNIAGGAGNDTLSGGPGENRYEDGPGDDTIVGGPNDDTWTAGAGADTFTPGDGNDTVTYTARTAPVTITLDTIADDGEAGEGDNVGPVEDATGGSGNDRIVGNDLGDRLHGGAGDDTIVGGKAEDRLEGNEGNDTIDSRDGRFDSVDCGPGSDVVYADPGDTTENCEVAPDRDGDGTLNEQDCAPDNAAIHPGAGEIVGNTVDEDCKGGPQYLRVISPVSYSTSRKGNAAKFTKFTVGELKTGDKVQIRCTSKSKGCPFSTKTITAKAGKRTVTVLSYFKKRYLKKGAVVEVRTTRPNEIGAVRKLTVVKKGNIKLELLCLAPGATKPSRCV